MAQIDRLEALREPLTELREETVLPSELFMTNMCWDEGWAGKLTPGERELCPRREFSPLTFQLHPHELQVTPNHFHRPTRKWGASPCP